MMISPNAFSYKEYRPFGSREIAVNYGANGAVDNLTDKRPVIAQLPSGESVPVKTFTYADTATPSAKASAAAAAIRTAQGSATNPINEVIVDRGYVKWRTAGQTDIKYNVLPKEVAEQTAGIGDVLRAAEQLRKSDSLVNRVTDKITHGFGSLIGRMPTQVEL